VNNAGILIDPHGDHSVFSTPFEIIQQSIDTNTYGALRMIRTFIPLLKKSSAGKIINLSSGMGQLHEMNGGWPGYRISKTALNAVTCMVADELKGTQIQVNSVCPGWVKTAMGGEQAELSTEEGADTIVWLATLPADGPTGGFFRARKPIEW
jgi:NAD(P)-dependent dehydrogenase (short-subunit alcohol dehydrogenase family)